MPLQATSGAASYDAFGGGVPFVPTYIEDVMSVWLYTGNGSTQTITNGIDLSTKGGLVWIKDRSAANSHVLHDSARGVNNRLVTNNTNAQSDQGTVSVSSFNTNGFSVGTSALINTSAATLASWTFRKQPKFFDVVTWTGNGANRTIAHNLGSVPGMIIVKRTDASADWQVYHRSLANTQYMVLNSNAAAATGATRWNSTTPTSTVFSLGTDATVNASGGTYVAYVYAHDAGGFGLTGTDNVISCGSFSSGSTANINLGWEPQWLLVKSTSSGTTGPWQIFDNMRGVLGSNDSGSKSLSANANDAEVSFSSGTNNIFITATGFSVVSPSYSGIYIAIRRGPMKVPTTGTSVFSPNVTSGITNTQITTGFPLDLNIVRNRTASSSFQSGFAWSDRLRGVSAPDRVTFAGLQSTNTNAETTVYGLNKNVDNTSFSVAADYSGLSQIYYSFRRAPGFFDVVCYTGNSTARTVAHNLAAVPELMIIKARTGSGLSWVVYAGNNKYLWLQSTNEQNNAGAGYFNNTAPTSTVFSVGTDSDVNGSGNTYVAYLFASAPGVSKVGSYTGNGSSQTINCGFTGGARFVMVKRTDSTGNWMVVDTARGLVSAGDPTLYLNSTAAEVTGVDWLDPDSSGFIVNQEGTMNANVSSATYIFLAVS